MWLIFLVSVKWAPHPRNQWTVVKLQDSYTHSPNLAENTKDTDTYSKLQCIHKKRGALSTNSGKKKWYSAELEIVSQCMSHLLVNRCLTYKAPSLPVVQTDNALHSLIIFLVKCHQLFQSVLQVPLNTIVSRDQQNFEKLPILPASTNGRGLHHWCCQEGAFKSTYLGGIKVEDFEELLISQPPQSLLPMLCKSTKHYIWSSPGWGPSWAWWGLWVLTTGFLVG